jgi:hypothetical protein
VVGRNLGHYRILEELGGGGAALRFGLYSWAYGQVATHGEAARVHSRISVSALEPSPTPHQVHISIRTCPGDLSKRSDPHVF